MVYLLHFDRPYRHAGHYIGFVERDLARRIEQHRNGRGARLMEVIAAAGIGFTVARTWDEGDRTFERQLKRRKKSCKLCPVCRAERAKLLKTEA